MKRIIKSRILYILLFILLTLLILFMLMKISPMLQGVYGFLKAVLVPFIIAMIISYILNPVVNLLHDRKMPRTIAVLLIYTVFIISVIVITINLIPMLMKQIKELKEHLPEITTQVQQWIEGLKDNRFIPDNVHEGLQKSLMKADQAVSTMISNFIDNIGATLNMLFIAFIIPFLAFYMLKDFQLIEKTALKVVPEKHQKHTIEMLVEIDHALGSYIRGQLLVCIIVGALSYLGYWLIDMPYPLLLASVVAVFNIVPFLGPFFGAAPAILMAATISMKMVLLVIMINLIVQILEGNVVSPQVVGRTLHLHPLMIIFVLLIGGELAGIIGLILAVPIYAALKVIVHHFYIYYLERKRVCDKE